MSQKSSFLVRFLGAVLLIALLAGGGYMAFRAGQAQGYTLGAASAIGEQSAASAAALPAYPMPYARHYGMGMHFSPFMGFFGFIPMLIGLCIVFWLFRLVFWGPRHMHHGHWGCGPYMHHHWDGESPCEEHEKDVHQHPDSDNPQSK